MAAINYTIGLKEIQFGKAMPDGTVATDLTKIGMVYKDTCSVQQDASETSAHYEEGSAVPFVQKKTKKTPTLTFSLVINDMTQFTKTVGGSIDGQGNWGMNGDELVANQAVKLVSKQGLDIYIPNADIDASINADYGENGVFLVNVTVTPLSVTSGKAFQTMKHE